MSCRRPQFANELERCHRSADLGPTCAIGVLAVLIISCNAMRAASLVSNESMYFSNGAKEGTKTKILTLISKSLSIR